MARVRALRFTSRQTDEGWGVWDAAIHGWRSTRDLTAEAAHALVPVLEAQYDTGQRPVQPPRRVEIRLEGGWWPGQLTAWARQPNGAWWGQATRDAAPGDTSWYPATHLRPAP